MSRSFFPRLKTEYIVGRYYRLARNSVLSNYEDYCKLPLAYVNSLIDYLTKEAEEIEKHSKEQGKGKGRKH